MDTIDIENVLSKIITAKGKNGKKSIKSVGNTKQYAGSKFQKKSVYSVQKKSYNYSHLERESSSSSPESSPETSPERRPTERGRSRTRRCNQSQSSKSLNNQNVTQKQSQLKAENTNTLSVLGNGKTSASIFPSQPYSFGQNFGKSTFPTSTSSTATHPMSFKMAPVSSRKYINRIKVGSEGQQIYKLCKGKGWIMSKPGKYASKSSTYLAVRNLVKDFVIHKTCGEAGKWKYIRMYQERARRRKARKKRQRQKQREEDSGKKSTRRRRKKSKSRKRSRSRSRKKSASRRKSATSGRRRRRG